LEKKGKSEAGLEGGEETVPRRIENALKKRERGGQFGPKIERKI